MTSLDNSFRAVGCGGARFLSLRAFEVNGDVARREHAAIAAFRANLAGGMPLEDAESCLRLDLQELAVDDEDWILSIVNNPDHDPSTLYGTASDFVEC